MTGGQRWGGGNGGGTTPNGHVSATGWGTGAVSNGKEGKRVEEKNGLDEGVTVFEVGEEEDDEYEDEEEQTEKEHVVVPDPWAQSERRLSNGGESHFLPSTLRCQANA